MSDDAGSVWRGQPKEVKGVSIGLMMNRRTQALYVGSRSEILMSVGAALLFAAVMMWRFGQPQDRLLQAGYLAVIAWAAITVYWFRRIVLGREAPRADSPAATGLEHYLKELERRRDHLRNAWIWHGPLVLACALLAAILTGSTFSSSRSLRVLPLVILLVLWTIFGFNRRRLMAKEIQREIDETL